MNDVFDADVPRLRAGAERFACLAERADGIAAELRASLDATGKPWGADAPGQSFAAVHEAPAAETLDRLCGLVAGLGQVGVTFDHAASALRTDGGGSGGVATTGAAAEDVNRGVPE